MEDKKMLTIKEVAAALSLSPATIRRYIHAGKIKVVKYNQRVYRIPREELERLKSGK